MGRFVSRGKAQPGRCEFLRGLIVFPSSIYIYICIPRRSQHHVILPSMSATSSPRRHILESPREDDAITEGDAHGSKNQKVKHGSDGLGNRFAWYCGIYHYLIIYISSLT